MLDKKYIEIYNKMRNMKIDDRNILNISEPGLFRKNTRILFIGQNPAEPKPELIPSDAILLENNINDNDFHKAYEESQKNWHFYKFICNFCKWENASILNIVHFPTKKNMQPSLKAIKKCQPVLKEAITLINPEIIFCVGDLSYERIKKMNLNYRIVRCFHYSYLLRKGKTFYEKQVKKLKEEIQPRLFQ